MDITKAIQSGIDLTERYLTSAYNDTIEENIGSATRNLTHAVSILIMVIDMIKAEDEEQ